MGAETYVCELTGDNGECGLLFSSWEHVHGSPNMQQGRQPRQLITTMSLCFNKTMCQLWQYIRTSSHSAEVRRQLMDQGHWKDRT